MVPLPPVAGTTKAGPRQQMMGTAWQTAVSLDSLSSKCKSKLSYLHFFPYRCRKGLNQMSTWAQHCLPSAIQRPYTHTLLPSSATGKTIGSLCALPFPHNPPFPEVTQSTMSEQCTYSLLISQLKGGFHPQPRSRAPVKQKVLKLMVLPLDSNTLFMPSNMGFPLKAFWSEHI